jgi:hypothetical protein
MTEQTEITEQTEKGDNAKTARLLLYFGPRLFFLLTKKLCASVPLWQ